MSINAGIIDQKIHKILEDQPEMVADFPDENRKRSAAFVLLCMSAVLEQPLEDVAEHLTEGGGDAGVDGLHIGDVTDGEFTVTLFQGKYKKRLDGDSNFPETGVEKAIQTLKSLFDPSKTVSLNKKLRPKVEEIRSLIGDNYFPNVRVALCNNGKRWKDEAQIQLDRFLAENNQTTFLHINHDQMAEMLRGQQKVNDTLKFSGRAIVEAHDFRRVFLGKVAVAEISELFNRHHDRLLERNVRRYLGLHSNRVNAAIHETLMDPEHRNDFYFFNNGITIICRKFTYNAYQDADYTLKMQDMQIINGGQTCKTIHQTCETSPEGDLAKTFVLVRVFELDDEEPEFVRDITYATNSQNPVDLRDLRTGDSMQRRLETGIADLGYTYKRQREEGGSGSNVLTSATVAEAVLAIWREKPQLAKFRRKEHFGKLYDIIFNGLNPAQAILAALIFRGVENERKRPTRQDPPDFLPYASHYISMLVGRELLGRNGITLDQVAHTRLEVLIEDMGQNREQDQIRAEEQLRAALVDCYGNREISLQQLAATFRRGDLLEMLTLS